MSRKTVRVEDFFNKPDEFSKLLAKIVKRHLELGDKSPLFNNPKINMDTFDANRIAADAKRADSEKHREQSENEMEQADTLYGRAQGQNVNTPGTLHNMENIVKGILLLFYKGNEEALSEFGFDVVIGTAKSPSPRKKN